MNQGQTTRQRRRQQGFSLVELLIVVAIIMIIAAIAIPKVNQMQMNARETAAVKTLQTLNQAETQYYSQFNRFAANLAELGPPASGQTGPSGADLIPKSLAEGKASGYVFEVKTTATGYTINANPESYNGTGRRTFYTDQSMVIHQNWSAEPANANSPELK